jgi:hypothetical protein
MNKIENSNNKELFRSTWLIAKSIIEQNIELSPREVAKKIDKLHQMLMSTHENNNTNKKYEDLAFEVVLDIIYQTDSNFLEGNS